MGDLPKAVSVAQAALWDTHVMGDRAHIYRDADGPRFVGYVTYDGRFIDARVWGGVSTAAPIMLRAKITAAEWAELRKLAVDRNTTPPQLVADALRAAYPLTPKEQSE